MKFLLAVVFVFLIFFCFGQTRKNSDALYDLTIAYKPAVISILTDTGTQCSSIVNSNIRKMTFTDITPGQYKIQISGQGQATVIRDSIVVKEGENLVLNLTFNGPCLYDHPRGYMPTCPKNHRDNIIPVVYGFVATLGDIFIKDKQDMKVKYAGCIMTGCDPQFYCKEHDIEF